MQAFEIAQRGNFVVVVFRVKPTIEVARFHHKGVVCNPVGDVGSVHEHKFKVGQSVSFTSGPFGRGGTNSIYKVTPVPEKTDEPHERVVKETSHRLYESDEYPLGRRTG